MAKKSKRKPASVKNSSRSKIKSRPAASTPLGAPAQLALLAHRLNSLEMAAQGATLARAAPSPSQRTIEFNVSNDTALIRISEVDDGKHAQVVVKPGGKMGQSAPHDNGVTVDFIVELSGSSGNSADIAIKNTDADKIHPVIPDDFTESWYAIQYTLKTKW